MSYKLCHTNKRPRNTPTHIYTCGCIPYDLRVVSQSQTTRVTSVFVLALCIHMCGCIPYDVHAVSQSQTTRVMSAALMCIPTATHIRLPIATHIRVSHTHCNTHSYYHCNTHSSSHCNTHSCLTYPLHHSFECETITAVGTCDTKW